MFTRCPNCNAAFSITGQQLVIAAGMVRCGICENVFDARPHLFQEPSSPPEVNEVVEKPTAATAQQKLSKDDLGLIDETTESIYDINEETEGFESVENEQASVPNIIAEEISNLDDTSISSKNNSLLGIILIWLLLAALAIQLIGVYKPSLFPQRWEEQICSWLTCVEQIARAPEKIEILNRSVHTHPHEDNALLATLTIINRSNAVQAYPIIQLRFLDLSGSVIAARLFDARQYLGANWRSDTVLPPNTPISIQLELHDTGEEVVSYDFEFL